VLPGIIGNMQANEAIKLITGIGKPLIDRLLTYNALTNNVYIVKIPVNKEADLSIPKNENEFRSIDYDWLCSSQLDHASEIDSNTFDQLLQENSIIIIDVREEGERPYVNEFKHLRVPLSSLKKQQPELRGDVIILFCQSGTRSLEAVQILKSSSNGSKKIYSLKGGISAWKKTKQ